MDAAVVVILLVLMLVVAAAIGVGIYILIDHQKKKGGGGGGAGGGGLIGAAAGRVYASPDPPLGKLTVRDPFESARGALQFKVETPQFVVFWDADQKDKTQAQTMETAKALAEKAEQCWQVYAKAGFKLQRLKETGQDLYKKPLFLSGCAVQCAKSKPQQDPGYDYTGGEGGIVYCTISQGTAAHELGHMRLSAVGGFSSWTLGSKLGWAHESCANYMQCCLEVTGEVPNREALDVWFLQHPVSLEVWDSGKVPSGYPYGAYFFWLWIQVTFGYTMPGRMWTESLQDKDGQCVELVPECLSRLTSKSIPDLYGDWLGKTLTFEYLKSDVNKYASLKLSAWKDFDNVSREGSTLKITNAKYALQAFGFHAAKLEGSVTSGKRLRLDPSVDASSWRMAVVVTGGKTEVYAAGQTTPVLDSSGVVVGVISVSRGAALPANPYVISLV